MPKAKKSVKLKDQKPMKDPKGGHHMKHPEQGAGKFKPR